MLELISLKKEYVTKAGNTQAINDISLSFPDKGLVFITGKSGSGKTTLLNVIGGLDGFDSGDIKLNGKSFSNFSSLDFDSYRNTFVGFVFQEYNLLQEYNIKKNIEIALELQGEKVSDEKIKSLLEMVELSGLEDRKPNQLSGGQKQRVAIVRALIKNPKIILADELTGALDSVTGEQVLGILKKLSKEKLCVVVSHDLELAEKYADRIIQLADGKIVDDITLNDVNLQGNIHQSGENLTVKLPCELNDDESKILISAIKDNKKINFTEKISVRQRSKTVQPKVNVEDIKLINSKMKFSSALTLGFKSIWTKPIRLFLTILLSVIAFAVFGLFDAIAMFNEGKVVTSLIRERTYPSMAVYSTYTEGSYYNGTELKLTQEQIDELNEDSGYSFRGIYDLVDTDTPTPSFGREGYNASVEIRLSGNADSVAVGSAFYTKTANGIITFDKSEIEGNVIDKDGFNFKILYGKYPVFNEDDEFKQVAISSYLAECIKFWLISDNTFGEKEINEIQDFIDAKIKIYDKTFVITAIIDCGEIPEKYDTLKSKQIKTLKADFETFINSGCFKNIFAPTGLVEHLRLNYNRTINYVSDFRNVAQSVYIDNSENEFVGSYYNTDKLKYEDNYLFFDEDKKTLEKNEALIDVKNLCKEYIEHELAIASDKSAIHEAKIALESSKTLKDRKNNLRKFVNQLSRLVEENDNFCKTITLKSSSRSDATTVAEDVNLKVVGIYYNIDSDSYFYDFSPIAVNQETLDDTLNITLNQGIYSRAVTPLFRNRSGEKILGQKMNQTQGLTLNWFANTVLENVTVERELVEQALDLVLYLTIVLAAFSVFMLFNYISISISSKRHTIGILRTLGANKKNIFIMFITEALIISIINGLFACVVSYLGCIFVNSYLLDIMNLTINIAMFDIRQVLIIIFGSLLAGIVSSLLPIIKISKKKPVELIRNSQ